MPFLEAQLEFDLKYNVLCSGEVICKWWYSFISLPTLIQLKDDQIMWTNTENKGLYKTIADTLC